MTGHHRSAQWAAFVRKARPILRASLPAPCVQPHCQLGGIVYPDQQWDVAHLPGVALGEETLETVGVAHGKCNRSDGGRLGAAMVNGARRDVRRMPSW